MANLPRKVAIIGLAGALTDQILKEIADGRLPAFKNLFEEGLMAVNCVSTDSADSGWAAAASGTLNGPDAQYLWECADIAGKKSILLNYPTPLRGQL